MTRPKPPSTPRTPPTPPRADDGISGKVRSVRKLRGAGPARGDGRRPTVEKIREFMSRNAAPARRAPKLDEGRVYDDEDESEN